MPFTFPSKGGSIGFANRHSGPGKHTIVGRTVHQHRNLAIFNGGIGKVGCHRWTVKNGRQITTRAAAALGVRAGDNIEARGQSLRRALKILDIFTAGQRHERMAMNILPHPWRCASFLACIVLAGVVRADTWDDAEKAIVRLCRRRFQSFQSTFLMNSELAIVEFRKPMRTENPTTSSAGRFLVKDKKTGRSFGQGMASLRSKCFGVEPTSAIQN